MVYYRKTDYSVCSWRVKNRLISGFHHHINDFDSLHLLQDLAWALSMNDRAPQMICWMHWTTGQDICIVSHLPLYALLSSLHQKISEIKKVDDHIEQSGLGLLLYLANNITEIFQGNWCHQATFYSPYSYSSAAKGLRVWIILLILSTHDYTQSFLCPSQVLT